MGNATVILAVANMSLDFHPPPPGMQGKVQRPAPEPPDPAAAAGGSRQQWF
jgi:hypothetical protein